MVGAGGVGGLFGARLAAAGNEVCFIARGRHGAAMKEHGLRLSSAAGDLVLAHPRVAADPAAFGPQDVVLICTKLWDNPQVLPQIAPLVGPETAIASLQNGVIAEEQIAEAYGRERTWGALCQVSAAIESPGVIRQTGSFARLVAGPVTAGDDPRVALFVAAAIEAGLEARASAHIDVEIWRKFALLSPFAAITCLERSAIGPLRDRPEVMARLAGLVGEVCAVGRASGVALGPESEAETMKVIMGLPADMKASMLVDLEAGNRLELDWLTGEVVRRGRSLGVPVPWSEQASDALAPFAAGSGRAA